MTWTAITKPAQGDSTKKTSFADVVIDDLTHLYNLSGGSGSGSGSVLQNGSFENDVDSDGIPDGWTQTLGAGASAAFDTTTPAHGTKAYKFTTSGSVDNYIEHEDFILCAVPNPVALSFLLKCSAAGVAAAVVLRWFDKAKAYISSTTIYTEGAANPTAWTRYILGATPPATACYFKVRLYGGVSGDATAGDVYFDGVATMQPSEWIYTVLASDFTTESATAVDVTGLAFTPIANKKYEFEGEFMVGASVTGADYGPRLGLAWATGMTNGAATIKMATGIETERVTQGNVSAALFSSVTTMATTGVYPAHLKGMVIVGASPSGTIKVQLASGGALINMRAGSFMKYREIS